MKNLIVLMLLVSGLAFGVTGNKVWRVPNGSTIPSWGPVNLSDNTNAVTGQLPKSNLASVGQQTSSISLFTTNSTTFTDVTGSSVSITTTGRPVMYLVQGVPVGGGNWGCTAGGSNCSVFLKLVRGSTDVSTISLSQIATSQILIPANLTFFDTPSSGTYTYKLQAMKSNATQTFAIADVNIFVWEM